MLTKGHPVYDKYQAQKNANCIRLVLTWGRWWKFINGLPWAYFIHIKRISEKGKEKEKVEMRIWCKNLIVLYSKCGFIGYLLKYPPRPAVRGVNRISEQWTPNKGNISNVEVELLCIFSFKLQRIYSPRFHCVLHNGNKCLHFSCHYYILMLITCHTAPMYMLCMSDFNINKSNEIKCIWFY